MANDWQNYYGMYFLLNLLQKLHNSRVNAAKVLETGKVTELVNFYSLQNPMIFAVTCQQTLNKRCCS